VHGLIFFYIQKYAEAVAGAGRPPARSTLSATSTKYLPTGVYPDEDAVDLIRAVAESSAAPLETVLERFGEFLAPHLVKVAGSLVEPEWRTLDLVEHTEAVIHAMVRTSRPGAAPPVIECVRAAPDELHVVYASRRRLCRLAVGLLRGVAGHFGEEVDLEEPACMLRGDPFCSFVVRLRRPAATGSVAETVELPTISPLTGGIRTTVVGPAIDGEQDARAAAFDPDRPASIGGYTVLRQLGKGGMGVVYLARDERLGREVAIKMMLPRRAGDAAARQRFLRESRATAAVEHENVVTIHQVGEHEGLPYLVMQRLEGPTVASLRDQVDHPPIDEVLRIGREIASGLAAAHRRGLVHRDVKPENVHLEGPGRQVKIIDFGLARDADQPAAKLTVEGAIIGTPAYMAPERIAHDVSNAKGDVFGLGVILYELLAGGLPFEGHSMVTMLASIARGSPRPLRTVAPHVPEPVAQLVMRLIAHAAGDRPDAAEAVASIGDLERRGVGEPRG
jgi:hypothetical protein